MSTQILGPDLHFDLAKAALGSANATLTLTPTLQGGYSLQCLRNPPVEEKVPGRGHIWSVCFSVDGDGRVWTDGYIVVSGKKEKREGKWRVKEPGASWKCQYMLGIASDETDGPDTACLVVEPNGTKMWNYLALDKDGNKVWGVHADGSMHSYAKGVQITFGAAAVEPPSNILAPPKWVDVRIEGDDRPYRMKLYPVTPGPVLPALPGAGQGINS